MFAGLPRLLQPPKVPTLLLSHHSFLLRSVRLLVNLHPNIHTNSTPPDIVINLLLADLLSQGTITLALHCHIIEQLL
jgi:hypothetical protein